MAWMLRTSTIHGHTVLLQGLEQPAVLDIGANHGGFAREMSRRFGGTYKLIEANPVLAAELATRFDVEGYAISEREGVVSLNVARNDEGSSLLTLPPTSPFDCTLETTVSVPARRLDDALASSGRLDVVKIDIEGAEIAALRDVDPALLGDVGQFSVEFHSDPRFGFGQTRRDVDEVLALMRERGFLWADFSRGTRMDVLLVNREWHAVDSRSLAARAALQRIGVDAKKVLSRARSVRARSPVGRG